MREHYKQNLEYYLAKAKRSNKKAREWLRAKLQELKAIPCADCGIQYPTWVMQFDHVRGVKSFEVANARNMNLDLLLAEVAKCEIVCANCHAQRTYQRSSVRP